MAAEDFDKVLSDFWKTHPVQDGWAIDTDIVRNAEKFSIKATITRKTLPVVTGHAKGGSGDDEQLAVKSAIANAIRLLPRI